MKINYINEEYFKPVNKHSPRTKEDVMKNVSKVLKQEIIEKKIRKIQKSRNQFSFALSGFLLNIRKALSDGVESYNYYVGKNLRVNNEITLNPLENKVVPKKQTVEDFYKNSFSVFGSSMPGKRNSHPVVLIHTITQGPGSIDIFTFTKNKILINLTYIAIPFFDVNMFKICVDLYEKRYHRDLIYDNDFTGIPKNDVSLRMATSMQGKEVRKWLQENRDLTLDDFIEINYKPDLVKRLVLTDEIMTSLKKDVDFFKDYLEKCLDVPVEIHLWLRPSKKPTFNNLNTSDDPIKII